MTQVSHGKPYAGKSHVRFEEGASAPANPRRNALLHIRFFMIAVLIGGMICQTILAGSVTTYYFDKSGQLNCYSLSYNELSVKTAEVALYMSTGTSYGGGRIYSCALSPDTLVMPFEVPREMNDYKIIRVGNKAFAYCSGLTSMTIPDCVTSIGENAFLGCRGLKSLTIPNSVTSIGNGAFYCCNGLTSVVIPNSVNTIAANVFRECSGLTSVTIPDSVKSIGNKAFENCSSLTSVTIPDSVKSIGDDVFDGCVSLRSVTIPQIVCTRGLGNVFPNAYISISRVTILDGVTRIGSYAFDGCRSLQSITIPNSVTDIDVSAFANCDKLKSFVVATGNTSYKAVSGMLLTLDGKQLVAVPGGLTHVTIPDSVRYIGEAAFCGCKGLTEITIPASVTNIGNMAFSNCDGLSCIYLPIDYMGETDVFPLSATITRYKTNQHVSFDVGDGNVLPETKEVVYGQAYGTLPVPSRTDYTGYTFAKWTLNGAVVTCDTIVNALADHTLVAQWAANPYTVMFFANGGDGHMMPTNLVYDDEYTLPSNSFENPGYSFVGWSITPDGKVEYKDGATISNLTSQAGGVVSLYAQWTANTYTMTFNANGGTGGKTVTQDYGTVIEAPTVTKEWCTFLGWWPTIDVAVPAHDVTYTAQWRRWKASLSSSAIAGKALRELYPNDYSYLTDVVLEEGVSCLPEGFFDGCANVVNLTLPESLESLGYDELPVRIRDSQSYNADGFIVYRGWVLGYRDDSVTELTIPEGVTGIGAAAFSGFANLRRLVLPASLQKIGVEAFRVDTDLDDVTIPDGVWLIAEGAFENCTAMQNLDVGVGVRHVRARAFKGCASLKNISFANGLKDIGGSAFQGDWRMLSVSIPYSVTNVATDAFVGCKNLTDLTVPTGLKTLTALFPDAIGKIDTVMVADGERNVIDGMFAGCGSLVNLTLPGSVTNLGARAFQGCAALTAIVVPNGVETMGEAVFKGCTGLWNVTLSRNLAAIPAEAFNGCSMLETMLIPSSVTNLGSRFFSGRTNSRLGTQIENTLYYLSERAPSYAADAYLAVDNLTSYVVQGSRGWDGVPTSRVLPEKWIGCPITYWTPNRFVVTFDANGGRFDALSDSTWSEQQITDTGYSLPSADPVRPGWVFAGWWTEPTGGAQIKMSTRVTLTRTHVLYAHWTSNVGVDSGNGSCKVTFGKNGGTGGDNYVTATYGKPMPTPRTAPTLSGYTFGGYWDTLALDEKGNPKGKQYYDANMKSVRNWDKASTATLWAKCPSARCRRRPATCSTATGRRLVQAALSTTTRTERARTRGTSRGT